MRHLPEVRQVKLPPGARLVPVLLTLVAYHGSFLPLSPSPPPACPTPSPPHSPSPQPSLTLYPPPPSTSPSAERTGSPRTSLQQNQQRQHPKKEAFDSWLPPWGLAFPGFSSTTPWDQGEEEGGRSGEGGGWGWGRWVGGWRRSRGGSAGADASTLCRLDLEQRRLTEMLNELQVSEDMGSERLALQQIWIRDNHNLTGVCPTIRPRGVSYMAGLNNQSLCPWSLEHNYRADRFPSSLWFARCLCGRCADTGSRGRGGGRGGGGGSHGRRGLYTCIPLYHRVAVIRQVCEDGKLHFRWGRESVPVGCVCAHQGVRHVD